MRCERCGGEVPDCVLQEKNLGLWQHVGRREIYSSKRSAVPSYPAHWPGRLYCTVVHAIYNPRMCVADEVHVQYTVRSTNRTQHQLYVLEYQQQPVLEPVINPEPRCSQAEPGILVEPPSGWFNPSGPGTCTVPRVCDLSLTDPLRVDRESQLSAKIPTQKLGRRDAKALLNRRFLSLLSTCESHNPQSLPREGKTTPKSSSWCLSR